MSVIRRLLLKKPLCKRNFSELSSKILNSGLEDIKIPEVTIDEYVFENVSKWEHLIATLENIGNYELQFPLHEFYFSLVDVAVGRIVHYTPRREMYHSCQWLITEAQSAKECAVTGRKYTYRETRLKSGNLNKSLRKKLKLEQGDVVAILLPNVPEFFIASLGILQSGLVITTINPAYTTEEISRQLLDSSAKAVITLSDLWPVASSSVKSTQRNIPILTVKTNQHQETPNGAINFTEFTDTEIDYPDVTDRKAHDLAILPYSSGTTGLPKGVMLSHFNIVSNLCQVGHPDVKVNEKSTETHQDITAAVLPLFHIYGFTITCMMQLVFGAKVVTLPKFTPELYVGTLKRHKPHVLFLAPPIAIFLANHPSVKTEDLNCIRNITSGAAPLGALDEKKLLEKVQKDIPIIQGRFGPQSYGLTETSPAVTSSRKSKEFENIYGSLGKPVPNTMVKLVAIDDHCGTPLGPNETGELLVKGPQVMMGYHNREKETDETFLDGWLRTGDMMYYDNDGFLFITDRLKELIKVKGFQVAPAELEEIIRHHPDVLDAAVIGIPHPKDGELPKAYVVPKQGVKINTQKIQEFVKEKVAAFKQIRGGITVIDSIPKNASGKILRRELKALYQNEKRK